MDRRSFLKSSVAVGAGLALARTGLAEAIDPASRALNIALIGAGAQGRVLLDSCLKIPGLKFQAICDIWSYSQTYASRYLKKYGHEVNVYEDYQELLEKEKGLDAAIVATPDFMHAEHAIACMEAGLDVYCEKEMSNSLAKARDMVRTARKTGALLQIGHQRRSNPRYLHGMDIINKHGILGRVTQANAQWNRAKSDDLGWPKKYEIDGATLAKYGYDSMEQFRNWRWYRKYGGGPMVDLGSHQIDIFAWVFGANPKSVMASGGIDFYKHHELYDNVMAIYEYDTPQGTSRAFYQVLTTTSNGGYYETFMGEDGTLVISENPSRTKVLREPHAEDWEKYAKSGVLQKFTEAPAAAAPAADEAVVDVRETAALDAWGIPVEMVKPYHQPHLENFFNAIRFGTPLNCPPEIGYETAVAVLTANEAVSAGKKMILTPSDFEVQ